MGTTWKAAIAVGAILVLAAAAQARANDMDICLGTTVSNDDGIAACTRVISSGASSRDQLGTAYIARGQRYYTKDQYDLAIEDFNKAIALNSSKWTQLAYGNRGNAYEMKGEDQLAIESYTKAIELDRTYAAAFTGRGLIYEKLGQIDKARADYQAALAVNSIFADNDWAHQTARKHLDALKDK
jgi:tetratricopeptide (TPR) repeat protein